MNSELFRLNWQDALKGLVVAALTTALSALLKIVEIGTLPTLGDLQSIGVIAITAGLSYLLKNMLTNSNGQILKSEVKQ